MKPPMLLFFLLYASLLRAQTCRYNDLSADFRFRVILHRITDADGFSQSGRITLFITNKRSGRQQQVIRYTAAYIHDKTFTQAKASRSYTTGKRRNSQVTDNDWGDLIVADFNFDGREDFAIVKDSGGNGGPTYSFYLQNSKGRFVQDSFLTNRMEFFPETINKKKHTLTTLVHANAYQMAKTTYHLNIHTGQWKKTKRRFLNY